MPRGTERFDPTGHLVAQFPELEDVMTKTESTLLALARATIDFMAAASTTKLYAGGADLGPSLYVKHHFAIVEARRILAEENRP